MHLLDDTEFWSGTYRGHTIAVLHHHGGWLVYLDHTLQHGKRFASAEKAIAWLRHKIDGETACLAA